VNWGRRGKNYSNTIEVFRIATRATTAEMISLAQFVLLYRVCVLRVAWCCVLGVCSVLGV
jgi:hypothetical protein